MAAEAFMELLNMHYGRVLLAAATHISKTEAALRSAIKTEDELRRLCAATAPWLCHVFADASPQQLNCLLLSVDVCLHGCFYVALDDSRLKHTAPCAGKRRSGQARSVVPRTAKLMTRHLQRYDPYIRFVLEFARYGASVLCSAAPTIAYVHVLLCLRT